MGLYIFFVYFLFMVQEAGVKRWVIANMALGVVSFLLLLHLFNVPVAVAGKAYDLSLELVSAPEALCAVEWGDEKTIFSNLDQCCLYARTQLSCERQAGFVGNEDVDWDCYTGRGKVVHYLLNQKAYRYCLGLPIGVD